MLKNKKGVLFSVDAVFALVTLLFMTSAIMFSISQDQSSLYSSQMLTRIGQDSLGLLEKDLSLQQAIDLSTTVILTRYLNSLPDSICADIYLYDTTQNQIDSASKDGCTVLAQKSIIRRSFITVGLNPYYAQMEISFIGTS
jgi:hypothetical protein